jgi:hypothetical protein
LGLNGFFIWPQEMDFPQVNFPGTDLTGSTMREALVWSLSR